MLKIFSFLSILELFLFSGIFYYFYTSPLFTCSCKKFFISFPLAKTTGWLININLFLLLLFQSKFLKKKFFISFSLKFLHYSILIYLYSWTLIHVICHYINFYKLNKYNVFSWGVGFTGHILVFCFLLLLFLSCPYFRRNKYHVFITMHYFLLFCVVIFSSIHGTFCFFKPDKNSNIKCFPPTTWAWVLIPTCIILYDIISKYYSKYKIHNIISHPGDIFELKLQLPDNYCGKTIHICCPNISLFEWHPFSVSYQNNGLSSVFIKIRGNWTKKFSNLLGIIRYNSVSPTVYPYILIDGPFYSLPTNITNIIYNKTTIFISSGIGLATFHNLLYSIINNNIPVNKLHFIIICRSIDDIEWTFPLLLNLLNIKNFNLYVFFTHKKYINKNIHLNIPFSYSIGRPNFESIFYYINIIHDTSSGKPNIFFSGKHSLTKTIKQFQNKYISYSNFYEL